MKLERAGHNPGAGKQQQLSEQREVSVTWLHLSWKKLASPETRALASIDGYTGQDDG